jgi:hypothetical protein
MARLARVQTLLAAATSGKRAIDSVYLDITDLAGLADEAADAVASGFAAKACIHPSQVGVVRAAYVPTPDSVARARRLLAAARDQPGVFTFEGAMVDEPVLRQARRIAAGANGEGLITGADVQPSLRARSAQPVSSRAPRPSARRGVRWALALVAGPAEGGPVVGYCLLR